MRKNGFVFLLVFLFSLGLSPGFSQSPEQLDQENLERLREVLPSLPSAERRWVNLLIEEMTDRIETESDLQETKKDLKQAESDLKEQGKENLNLISERNAAIAAENLALTGLASCQESLTMSKIENGVHYVVEIVLAGLMIYQAESQK